MPSKDSIYGLFSPKKLNPNLIVIGIIIVILTIILVYSGRHSRITGSHFFLLRRVYRSRVLTVFLRIRNMISI
jgi:hypothetical protein